MTRTDELRQSGATARGEGRAPHLPHSAREVLAGNLGRDPYEGIEELREIGAERAKWEGVAYQLDHERKALVARLATEYASAHAKENLSEAKLERMALADPRYADHVRRAAEAVTAREHATTRYYATKSELEWDTEALRHLNHMSRLS